MQVGSLLPFPDSIPPITEDTSLGTEVEPDVREPPSELWSQRIKGVLTAAWSVYDSGNSIHDPIVAVIQAAFFMAAVSSSLPSSRRIRILT